MPENEYIFVMTFKTEYKTLIFYFRQDGTLVQIGNLFSFGLLYFDTVSRQDGIPRK